MYSMDPDSHSHKVSTYNESVLQMVFSHNLNFVNVVTIRWENINTARQNFDKMDQCHLAYYQGTMTKIA